MEVICKGCESKCSVGYNAGELEYHHWARSDSYGIYTGLYCDKCYKNIFKKSWNVFKALLVRAVNSHFMVVFH